VLNNRYGFLDKEGERNLGSGQANAKRKIKEKIYNRLPTFVGPTLFFLYRYFIQLGFLDGRPGLIYHFLQGYWYRFLVEAKVIELEEGMAACASNDERLTALRKLTGLKL
jgi:hypothetical protein